MHRKSQHRVSLSSLFLSSLLSRSLFLLFTLDYLTEVHTQLLEGEDGAGSHVSPDAQMPRAHEVD